MRSFLFILIVFISFSSNSQEKFNSDDFLADYKIAMVYEQVYADSVTVISRVAFKASPLITYGIFVTHLDYENGTFETVQLKNKGLEVFYNNVLDIAVIDNKFFRLRSKKKGKKMFYFMDEFTSDELVLSTTPFFEGLIAEGYTGNYRWAELGDKFMLTTLFRNFKKNTAGYVSKINLTLFDKSLMQISNFKHSLGEGDFVYETELVTMSTSSDYFCHYPIHHFKKSKTNGSNKVLEIIRFTNENYNVIGMDKSPGYINSLSIDSENDQLTIIGSEEDHYNLSLYQLNDSGVELLSSGMISAELVNKDYSPGEKEFQGNWRFRCKFQRIGSFISEKEEGVYYQLYCRRFESSEYGTIINDILVIKLNNNEVEWGTFIKASYPFALVSAITEDDSFLILHGPEGQGFFDNDGKYKSGKSVLTITKKFDVDYRINVKTGEFEREIVK